MIQGKYADFKHDIHPKSWLSKYRKNTIRYVFTMALFYHSLALIPMIIAYIAEISTTGNTEQHIPFNVIQAVTAGPFEETLFFGIPFYATGNSYVVLGTGILWSSLHLFNSGAPILDLSNLTYANFCYVVPTLFFSLRTWRSGKGWFSILFHSAWDLMAVLLISLGSQVVILSSGEEFYTDIVSIILAVIFSSITYPIYRWRKKRNSKVQTKNEKTHDVILIGEMKCPKCKNSIPNGSDFCNHCGTKILGMCSKCRHDNPKESTFCNKCGFALK